MARFVLAYLLMLTAPLAYSQKSKGTLENLFSRYENSNRDSNKVRLLLQIDSVYLYRMPDTKTVLDSALLMAQQAKAMSSSIDYLKGHNDATFMMGNSFAEKNDIGSAIAIMRESSGPLKIRLLIMLGERYLFRQGALKQNVDSAYSFIAQARHASDSINSLEWIYNSLRLLGKYYFTIGNIEEGKNCFMRIINDYHQSGNEMEEAFWWNELATYLPDSDKTFGDEIGSFANAFTLYKKINAKEQQPSVLEDMAFIYKLHNKPDLAEPLLIKAIAIRKSLNDKRLLKDYNALVQLAVLKGNLHSTIYYALEVLKNIDTTSDRYSAGVIYYQLGTAYEELGEKANSLKCFTNALNLLGEDDRNLFPALRRVIEGLIGKDSSDEALLFLEKFIKKNVPVRTSDKEVVASAKGDCFNALGKYDQAEKNYLEMIELDEEQQKHFSNEISASGTRDVVTGSEAYYTIGNFYVERKRFDKAAPYLRKALTIKFFASTLERQSDIYFLLSRVDSAQGNYLSAMNNFIIHKQLHDSIFNIAKTRDIEELKIAYETDKKQKDLNVLSALSQVQVKELQRSEQTRKFIIILLIVLIILTGVVYSRYQIKQKSNKQLQVQQNEINSQNLQLRHLLTEQQKLVTEKEWLVKEIHHRVKNNLQIVISLLNVQSDYLDNPSALNAIQESRERMQAIALIHQKLYQPNYGTLIKMKSYIEEMVGYLGNFTGSKKVFFKLDAEDIGLDVSQAVPLGLILNEAITNSLKYAFAPPQKGTISIDLHKNGLEQIVLTVADDGEGFPKDFNFSGNKSLGIKLINLFAEQLDGELQFENKNGARIILSFRKRLPVEAIATSSLANANDEDAINN